MQRKARKEIKGFLTAVGRGVDKIAVAAREKVGDVSDTARPGVDQLTSRAHAAIDEVADAAARAVNALDRDRDILAAPVKWVENARGYAREHPLVSLAIAVAVTWALSRLTLMTPDSRRRRAR